MAKKLEWTVACALTALALFLHVAHFRKAGPLWRDEAAAVALATQPSWGEVFESFPHEAFPLLFPGAVRVWVAVTGGADVGNVGSVEPRALNNIDKDSTVAEDVRC